VHNKRLAAARRIMRKRRCNHLLVTDAASIEYLSGFSASQAILLIAPKTDVLFTDFRYEESARRFCSVNRPWKFIPVKGYGFSFLASLVAPGSVVAFQSDAVTVDELEKLKRAVPHARFAGVPREISSLGIVKTKAESAAMKKAALIAETAFAQFLRRHLRSGITEREAAARLDCTCAALGSERCAFDTIMLFGERTSLPHGRPVNRRLKKGDLVLVDFGCTVSGLCSDITRTLVFGTASRRQQELYAIVKQAQDTAICAARAGLVASSLDRAARSVIEKAGYGKAFGHALGHGVGRRVHERPRVSSKSKEVLQEGTVITIEPGIYLPGFGGVRIEDMVLLKNNGSRLLTHAPRTLIER
jgi:Xaa-Pro aminopeptidase